MPAWIPFDKQSVLSSDEILRMEHAPSSLIIAGGGDIGVEFGYLYHTIGTAVTIIEMKGSILPFAERDVSATLQRILVKRGMKVLTETSVEHVKTRAGQKEVISAEKMLVALGRRPVTGKTGLEDLGIELNHGFVKVNERYETSQAGIFAIGDVIGPPLLAHAASQEGISAVLHIAGKEAPPIDPRRVPGVNYCSPQVAGVGLTSAEAEAMGYEIKTGKFPFSANSKAIISGEEEAGFVKIVADKKYGEVLGIHMIGPDVSEFAGGLSLAMSLEATALDISHAIFPHPTLSEVLKEAAHAVEGGAIHI
jgi:dihydrolipoamide dehydrogenase